MKSKEKEYSYLLIPSRLVHSEDSLFLSERAYQQIRKLMACEGYDLQLRVGVSGGGCSGFKYQITLNTEHQEKDVFFSYEEVTIVIDELSLSFLVGSTIDYLEEMMVSHFDVKNPNAKSSCGCRNSFSPF